MITKVLLGIILALSGTCAMSMLVSRRRKRRAETAEAEALKLRTGIGDIRRRALRLQETLKNNRIAEEEANDKRAEIAAVADSDLADHANRLFGVRDSEESP